jgi:septal ring factor EnvC (AmiA/AmiB activator)
LLVTRENPVTPTRWSGLRLGFTLAMVLGLVGLGAASPAAGEPAARKREVKVAPKGPDVSQELGAVAEAQRSLAADISQLRDQLSAVQRGVGEGHDEVRQNRDQLQAALEQIKGMREEVRGLYVETSGLKGDIAQLGKQVEGLEGSLGSFRLSAGIVVAVVLLLQLLLAGLLLRGRG